MPYAIFEGGLKATLLKFKLAPPVGLVVVLVLVIVVSFLPGGIKTDELRFNVAGTFDCFWDAIYSV